MNFLRLNFTPSRYVHNNYNLFLLIFQKPKTPYRALFKAPLTPKQHYVTPANTKPRFMTSTAFASKRKPSPSNVSSANWRSNTFSTPSKQRCNAYSTKVNRTALGLTPIQTKRPGDRKNSNFNLNDDSPSISRQSFLNVSSSTSIEPSSTAT